MSIEAMAMAGMDYKESGINFEEWNCTCREQPPLHLEDDASSCSKVVNKGIVVEAERMKEKLREWAKAVASNEKCTLRCS